MDVDLSGIDGRYITSAGPRNAPEFPVNAFLGCWIFDRKNGIHQRREIAEIDAADRAVKLIQRIRLAALQNTDSINAPVIREIGER